jgi:asparagine synthase (glutamine-hydrolysing)
LAEPHGLSVEFPLLTNDLVRTGMSLSQELRWDCRGQKPILKQLASRHMPPDLVYASKIGFESPVAGWLKGPLAKWPEVLLEDRTTARGLYDPAVIPRLSLERDQGLIITAATTELYLRRFLDA